MFCLIFLALLGQQTDLWATNMPWLIKKLDIEAFELSLLAKNVFDTAWSNIHVSLSTLDALIYLSLLAIVDSKNLALVWIKPIMQHLLYLMSANIYRVFQKTLTSFLNHKKLCKHLWKRIQFCQEWLCITQSFFMCKRAQNLRAD